MAADRLLHARDLPSVASLDALRAALAGGPATPDLRFVHAPAAEAGYLDRTLTRGTTLFGPGNPAAMQEYAARPVRTREVTSVLLHDAVFDPGSMTVSDRHRRPLRDALDNVADPERFAPAAGVEAGPALDGIALPLCGIGLPNYGHFLFDGLPVVFLHTLLFPDLPLLVVTQKLGAWQAAILAALGLRERVLELSRPTRLRRMLASTALAMHVSYPSQFIRPMFDLLRFRAGAAAEPGPGPGKLFLSRAGHDGVRCLRNRAAVEQAMTVLGYTVVQPDRLEFAQQVVLMGTARIVVGESGAGMANIGFCPPGTKILELQPECFPESWIRGTCFQLGHRWHLYSAQVADPPAAGAQGPRRFAYEIDPLDLMVAVARIESQP